MTLPDARIALKKFFGYDNFRPNQAETQIFRLTVSGLRPLELVVFAISTNGAGATPLFLEISTSSSQGA